MPMTRTAALVAPAIATLLAQLAAGCGTYDTLDGSGGTYGCGYPEVTNIPINAHQVAILEGDPDACLSLCHSLDVPLADSCSWSRDVGGTTDGATVGPSDSSSGGNSTGEASTSGWASTGDASTGAGTSTGDASTEGGTADPTTSGGTSGCAATTTGDAGGMSGSEGTTTGDAGGTVTAGPPDAFCYSLSHFRRTFCSFGWVSVPA